MRRGVEVKPRVRRLSKETSWLMEEAGAFVANRIPGAAPSSGGEIEIINGGGALA